MTHVEYSFDVYQCYPFFKLVEPIQWIYHISIDLVRINLN